MNYKVEIEPMLAHINKGETITKVFQSKSKSIEFFAEICIQYGYEMSEGIMDAEVEAGGIGHDYRITWSEVEETTFDITQYNHWGFAEWVKEQFNEDPRTTLSANVFEDETESVFYVDLYVNDELCDSFYYIEEDEIYSDLRTASNQFNTKIVDRKPMC
jgi:hypothetical protein